MIFTGIVISSIIFINFQLDDYEMKREMLEISRYVFNNTDGVNHYNPGSGYLNYVRYEIDNFPMSRYDYESPNILWDYYDPNSGTNYTFDSIEKYVEFGQSRNLTHIVTNGHNADPDILNDLFFNENNYPYVENGSSYTLSLEITNNGNQTLINTDNYTTNPEFFILNTLGNMIYFRENEVYKTQYNREFDTP